MLNLISYLLLPRHTPSGRLFWNNFLAIQREQSCYALSLSRYFSSWQPLQRWSQQTTAAEAPEGSRAQVHYAAANTTGGKSQPPENLVQKKGASDN